MPVSGFASANQTNIGAEGTTRRIDAMSDSMELDECASNTIATLSDSSNESQLVDFGQS
jgi:hypothetical protein